MMNTNTSIKQINFKNPKNPKPYLLGLLIIITFYEYSNKINKKKV